MAVNAYETVAGFKAWLTPPLTDSGDDTRIDDALGGSSRGVDNFCHTQFWQAAPGTTRRFDTCDPWTLRIGDWVAVTEVATDLDRDGVYETVWAASDFQLLPLNPADGPELRPYTAIRAIGTLSFPQPSGRRLGLIRVTGTPGWPAFPEPVVQATRLVANRALKRPGSPEGVAGFDEFGTIRISSRDDPDAVRYLTPYKTNHRVGGWAFA